MNQITRDEAVLRDLECDLVTFEEQYKMASDLFFQRWKTGELGDVADFMEWSTLYQMTCEMRERLNLLHDEPQA